MEWWVSSSSKYLSVTLLDSALQQLLWLGYYLKGMARRTVDRRLPSRRGLDAVAEVAASKLSEVLSARHPPYHVLMSLSH